MELPPLLSLIPPPLPAALFPEIVSPLNVP